MLSANRQKWIEALRETIAEFVSLLVTTLVIKANWHDRWEQGRGPLAKDKALLDKLERMVLTQWKIRLLLNPTEADHQEPTRTIDTALKRLQSDESTEQRAPRTSSGSPHSRKRS